MDRDCVLGERLEHVPLQPRRLVHASIRLGDDEHPGRFWHVCRERPCRQRYRRPVEVLERRHGEPRPEHPLDRGATAGDVGVEADHRQLRLRRRHEPQPCRRDDAERPLRADQQALQVVAGDILTDRAADADELAGGNTASSPITHVPVTPYLNACGPPAFVAMLPPI